MTVQQPQLGLVLAGGGAKGAYQAGALEYIAEIGLHPQIIAGTSIGALNGAVVAASLHFPEGVKHLSELWDKLGQADIICPSARTVTQVLGYAARTATPNFSKWAIEFLNATGILEETRSIFDPKPIEYFLREAVNPVHLRQGIELWITAFPSLKIPGVDYDLLTTAIDLLRADGNESALA